MKKKILCLISVVLVFGNIFGKPYLKLKTPKGGEVLFQHLNYTIIWEAKGFDRKVHLVLFKGKKLVGYIAKNLNWKKKSFPWKVGHYMGGVLKGNNIQIKIIPKGGKPNIKSASGKFSIKKTEVYLCDKGC